MKKDRRNHSLSLSHTSGTGLKRLALSVAVAFTGILGLGEFINASDLPDVGDAKGSAISTSGPNMTITTPAGQQRSTIDWKSFSIGAGNQVTFVQPNGKAITLNRVTGTEMSRILGQLQANGHIILANPNGIHIGPNAKINTAALTAVAGKFSDEQLNRFLQGSSVDPLSPDRVMAELTGKVKNEGEITAEDKGLVVLLGAQVENNGKIVANKGTIMLASGPQATLDFTGDGLIGVVVDNAMVGSKPGESYSVTNAGTLVAQDGTVIMSAKKALDALESVVSVGGHVIADSVSTDKGGNIVISGADRTTVTGTLSAKGPDGGNITVLGDKVELAGTAKLDATGTQSKGGKILVGGSYQGKGPEKAAKSTSVAKGAQLVADGKKDGGQAVVWSDGDTRFAGSASAKGGEKGGVVETSGKRLTVTADAKVDTSGSKQAGTWLLDPAVVNIEDTDTDGPSDGNGNGEGSVAASVIAQSLQTSNVDITATDRINVNSAIVAPIVGTDGSNNYYGLRLLASGTVGTVTAYNDTGDAYADAKRNNSGSIYINAPILLKNGHLVIAATGDVMLNDASAGKPGDPNLSRAIIDVGKGTIWIKTSNTASVIQQANTALIGDKVAVAGASVLLESPLNYAGTLMAGQASNGVFRYNQTNASGAVNVGKVDSPYTVPGGIPESMDGVTSQTINKLGEKVYVAKDGAINVGADLSFNDQEFDYLIFSAVNYVDANGNPLSLTPEQFAALGDSSDYFIQGLTFTQKSASGPDITWELIPDTSKANKVRVNKTVAGESKQMDVDELPPGFAFDAYQGQVVAIDHDPNAGALTPGWGVQQYADAPGAKITGEIQRNANTGKSEELVVALGAPTTEVKTTFGYLMEDGQWMTPAQAKTYYEAAKVQYLKTTDTTHTDMGDGKKGVDLNSKQAATVEGKINDATREYGDDNPQFSHTQMDLANDADANSKAVKAVDDFVDQQLNQNRFIAQTDYATDATKASNIGTYDVKSKDGTFEADAFVSHRYQMSMKDGQLTVTPAQLTVAADDKTKVYGDADPVLTHGTVSGLKNGDSADEVLNDGALTRDGAGTRAGENVGSYGIRQGGLDLNTQGKGGNYTLVFQDGTLTITPADATVTIHDKSKIKGSPDPALTYDVDGLKFADDKLDGSVTRQPGEDIGAYGIHEDSPFNNPNYRVTVKNGTLTITGPVRIPDQPVPPAPPAPPVVPTEPSAPPAPPAPGEAPAANAPITAQAPGTERCNAVESPSAVIGGYTVTPAVTRTYDVQLICKPRSYEDKYETLPEISDILTYVNNMAKEGKFQIPDWNRTVIPRDLNLKNEKGGAK